MYEENLTPLPEGDIAEVFAEALATIKHLTTPPRSTSAGEVVRWARPDIQRQLIGIARRLLLPGSGIRNPNSLAELKRLAMMGHSCLVCLNHRSNLDVPTLGALLADRGDAEIFQRLIWISGRKLDEDVGFTSLLVQGVNRVIVTPKSWLRENHSTAEWREARRLNFSAHRAIHGLRHRGWMFGLFPSATRLRPHDALTAQAIEETDGYLKHFEYLVLGNIEGCTLPATLDRNLIHEKPIADRIQYSFGPVMRCDAWRALAASRYPDLNQRTASALAITEDIGGLKA